MRKLVVTENITLDGVIDATEGWFDPTADDENADQTDVVGAVRAHMEAQDALLLGRATFEAFRGYWPKQTDDSTGITDHLNAVSKYVVSNTLEDPGWENTTVLRGRLEDEIKTLKAQPGNEIGITGSIMLVHELIRLGLVDEYRLFVYPVVLGRGTRLFEDATNIPKLKLVECRAFRSGIVLTSYNPDR